MPVRLLFLAAIVGFAGPTAAQEPRKFAFVVGVNEYKSRGFSDLGHAENDARELAKTLRGLGFDTVELLGAAATKDAIEPKLLAHLKPAGKRDIVLLAFSGHGLQLPVRQPDGSTKEDAFYCPQDANRSDPATLFSLTRLTDVTLRDHGGRNLLLVDACRDQPDDPSRGARGVQGKVVSLPEDTAILFSCRARQRSFESKALDGGHGLFTAAVLRGLKGGAARNGELTWTGLADYVGGTMVSDEFRKHLPPEQLQEPLLSGQAGHIRLGSIVDPAAAGPENWLRPGAIVAVDLRTGPTAAVARAAGIDPAAFAGNAQYRSFERNLGFDPLASPNETRLLLGLNIAMGFVPKLEGEVGSCVAEVDREHSVKRLFEELSKDATVARKSFNGREWLVSGDQGGKYASTIVNDRTAAAITFAASDDADIAGRLGDFRPNGGALPRKARALGLEGTAAMVLFDPAQLPANVQTAIRQGFADAKYAATKPFTEPLLKSDLLGVALGRLSANRSKLQAFAKFSDADEAENYAGLVRASLKLLDAAAPAELAPVLKALGLIGCRTQRLGAAAAVFLEADIDVPAFAAAVKAYQPARK